MIAIRVIYLAATTLVVALFRRYWPVTIAQIIIGSTSSVFIPAVAAISLGLVRRDAFARRQGRLRLRG